MAQPGPAIQPVTVQPKRRGSMQGLGLARAERIDAPPPYAAADAPAEARSAAFPVSSV